MIFHFYFINYFNYENPVENYLLLAVITIISTPGTSLDKYSSRCIGEFAAVQPGRIIREPVLGEAGVVKRKAYISIAAVAILWASAVKCSQVNQVYTEQSITVVDDVRVLDNRWSTEGAISHLTRAVAWDRDGGDGGNGGGGSGGGNAAQIS